MQFNTLEDPGRAPRTFASASLDLLDARMPPEFFLLLFVDLPVALLKAPCSCRTLFLYSQFRGTAHPTEVGLQLFSTSTRGLPAGFPHSDCLWGTRDIGAQLARPWGPRAESCCLWVADDSGSLGDLLSGTKHPSFKCYK